MNLTEYSKSSNITNSINCTNGFSKVNYNEASSDFPLWDGNVDNNIAGDWFQIYERDDHEDSIIKDSASILRNRVTS